MANNASSYVPGNCTWYVADQLPWIPAGLGNAGDWLDRAAAKGFVTAALPVTGSVVVYRPGPGYDLTFGHVAIVTGVNPNGTFQVREMNYSWFNKVDERSSTMDGVAGFILPPGSISAKQQPAGQVAASTTAATAGSDLVHISYPGGGIDVANPLAGVVTNTGNWIKGRAVPALETNLVPIVVGLIIAGVILSRSGGRSPGSRPAPPPKIVPVPV